jgi:hypothetical protein
LAFRFYPFLAWLVAIIFIYTPLSLTTIDSIDGLIVAGLVYTMIYLVQILLRKIGHPKKYSRTGRDPVSL